MASDDLSREPRAPGDPEEVRIITVDEIAEASSRPDVATRLPERDLPPPPPLPWPPMVRVDGSLPPPAGEVTDPPWPPPPPMAWARIAAAGRLCSAPRV